MLWKSSEGHKLRGDSVSSDTSALSTASLSLLVEIITFTSTQILP